MPNRKQVARSIIRELFIAALPRLIFVFIVTPSAIAFIIWAVVR